MKTIIFTFLFSIILIGNSYSQDQAKVEKSITSMQIGVLSVWLNNEYGLTDKIALSSEIGLNSSLFGGFSYDKSGIVLAPTIMVEPKYYYNLQKRKDNGKNSSNNNGNYFSLKMSYSPDWFVISNYENINIVPQVIVIPSWGFKRNISKKFMYEIGTGFGYRHIFYKKIGYTKDKDETFINLHLRIGYNF